MSEGIGLAFAIPGDLATPTGGYVYDRRVLALLAGHGVNARVLALPGSFPFPSQADLEITQGVLESVAPSEVILADGLALGAFPPSRAGAIGAPLIALCHHPLGLEAGLSDELAHALIENERAILARINHVIVTSNATRATLIGQFGVAADVITVAEPGVDRAPPARGSGSATVNIIAVGSIVPRKGYDILIDALAQIQDLDWRLRIVGAMDRAPRAVAALHAQIESSGLTHRVEFTGAADDAGLAVFYDQSDLFVSASRYEGYGMVLAEAMVRGLPIVSSTGGAAADTVPDDAALKVAPEDVAALASALRRATSDAGLRERLGAAALEASVHLPTWDSAASTIAEVVRTIHMRVRR
ncbi:MAG: glycosyltransferase family 4 protein [Beijerinckiaceae bacterium]|nr:glycosyltransferase family 4 protein [Beijerinckiaceae bacterium]